MKYLKSPFSPLRGSGGRKKNATWPVMGGSNDMHFNASPEIFRRAKELRNRMTHAESELWERLRAKKLNGLHFRRQHPVFRFILDFYCHKYRLAIELDGEVHEQMDQKVRDKGREDELNDIGITVLRFENQFVIQEIEEVLRRILNRIEKIQNKSHDSIS